MGSTRLPGKILKDLGGKKVLEHVVDRCRLSKKVEDVIVATSTLEKDNATEDFLKSKKIKYFRGDERDVLKRYFYCAKEHQLDLVVRVTADCPFLDPDILDRLIELSIKEDADYTSISNSTFRSFPHGVEAEVIKFSALQRAFEEATSDFDKEHVCPYIHKTKREEFKISLLKAKEQETYPEVRITLDTPQDYEACKELLKFLSKDFSTADIVKIYKENPYLKEINPT